MLNFWSTCHQNPFSPSVSVLWRETFMYGKQNAHTSTSLPKFHCDPIVGSPDACMTVAGPSSTSVVLTRCDTVYSR